MSTPFTAKVSVDEHVLVNETDGESVILNLNDESYYGLDKIGTRMWNVIATSDSIEEAYRVLLDEYDVDAGQLRKDIGVLVEKLIGNRMLKVVED